MSGAPKVTVVDYGMGNVLSVRRALEFCGADVVLTAEPDKVANAERLVLPGVGAFGDCMQALQSLGLIEPTKRFVETGRPFLGICVGMQILLDIGEEFGEHPGLGLIPGRVVQIDTQSSDGLPRKIPHIGWSAVRPPADASAGWWGGSPFAATDAGTAFYFVHSFTAAPSDPAHVLARADYAGVSVVAAVRRDNISGVQFHPEKSGPAGLAMVRTFTGND